jgi:hypothetical protein
MARCRERLGWCGAFAVAAIVCTGCPAAESGPPTAHLQGTVTLNGGPIPADADGNILFYPVDNSDSHPASALITDGKYVVENAPIGKVRVTINLSQPTGKNLGTQERPSWEHKNLVPESMKDGQEIQVDADNSNLNFDLK